MKEFVKKEIVMKKIEIDKSLIKFCPEIRLGCIEYDAKVEKNNAFYNYLHVILFIFIRTRSNV